MLLNGRRPYPTPAPPVNYRARPYLGNTAMPEGTLGSDQWSNGVYEWPQRAAAEPPRTWTVAARSQARLQSRPSPSAPMEAAFKTVSAIHALSRSAPSRKLV